MRTRSRLLLIFLLGSAPAASGADPDPVPLAVQSSSLPVGRVGYTELSTNLPGGRHANIRTMRARVMSLTDGGSSLVAGNLADNPDSWTQFSGWSPDGRLAIVSRGWQSPDNAAWEEEHRRFRFSPQSWSLDAHLVDVDSQETRNITGVERVSFYNSGLFFWPGDPSRLGFTALIDGNSHPFNMDSDGRRKVDLTANSNEFSYGFGSAPNGRRIAYHKSYQIHLADADGSHSVQVQTGNPFNFAPTWSPDGKHVLFVSGEHYNCHPCIVDRSGNGFRRLADRGGYRGVTEFLDVFDFHGGSSDTPVWSVDGRSIFYTALVDGSVELFQLPVDGTPCQLTSTPAGSSHYHPEPSQDGRWLLYGGNREGARQQYVLDLQTRQERQLTHYERGRGAMWARWQPAQSGLP